MTNPPRQAVILAGGLATRMTRLFPHVAKVTYRLHGRPMLHYLFDWVAAQNLKTVHLCLGHLADQVLDAVPTRSDLDVTYTIERELLGGFGSLRLSLSHLEPEFVLLYGDVLPRVALDTLWRGFEVRDGDVQLTVCPASKTREAPNIAMDPTGRVRHYGAGYAATHLDVGLTLVRRRIVECLPDGPVSAPDFFARVLARDGLRAMSVETPSLEIGSAAGYHLACAGLGPAD
jgi:CTP:molybdopterin cytidylyltransferase MocA